MKRLKELSLTQADLARRVGVSKGTVYSWIKQDRYPPADRAVRIARSLDTTVEDLINGCSPLKKDMRFEGLMDHDREFRESVLSYSHLDQDRRMKIQGMIELYHTESLAEVKK